RRAAIPTRGCPVSASRSSATKRSTCNQARGIMADDVRDDIPFNRDFTLAPASADEVMPGVRRVLVNNPSPYTFTGTLSYIIGRGKVAILDPGPDDPVHRAALIDAVKGESVTHILVSHTHRDHSPGARALAVATGAKI